MEKVTAVDEAQALYTGTRASEEDLRAMREVLAQGRATRIALPDATS